MSTMNTRRRTEVLIKSIDSFVENQKREIQESFRKHTLETFVGVFIIIYNFLCFIITNQNIMPFYHSYGRQPRKAKKSPDDGNNELLGSLIDTEEKDKPRIDDVVRTVKNPKEEIAIIKQHDEILKEQNKKIINIAGKKE